MSYTKILIVEDDAILALSLKRFLISFGYSVSGITLSGENTIGMAEMEHPDLILMDLLLKGSFDGVSTAAKILNRKDLPIIYMTTHAGEDMRNREIYTMPYGCLTKPVDKRKLRAIIRRAMIWHGWGKKSYDYGKVYDPHNQGVPNLSGLVHPIPPNSGTPEPVIVLKHEC